MMWRSRTARLRDEALLVAFAERLCEVSALAEPRAPFRDSLRTTLLMEASTALAAPPMAPSTPAAHALRALPRRRLAIATALVASTLGMGGMAGASAAALPGETLYPVKRGIERVELALKRGDADRGVFQLELAAERLGETADLADLGDGANSLEADTLADYNQQADDGTRALIRSYKASSDAATIVMINRFATAAHQGLTSLDGKLEGAAAAVLAAAQRQLSGIVEMSFRLCPDCGGMGADLVRALDASDGGSSAESAPDSAEPSGPDAPTPFAPDALPPSTGVNGDGESAATDESESESEDESDEEESSDNESRPADKIQLPALPNVLTPTPLPSPPLTYTPTPTATPSPTASPTATSSPTPTPSPTPSCHLDQGNGNSCHLTPPGPGLPLEEGAPTIDQQLVERLLDGLANLIGDIE